MQKICDRSPSSFHWLEHYEIIWFKKNKKTNKDKECVSNATAVQKNAENSRAGAKGILRSATEKCQQISFTLKKKTFALDKTKIHSPSSVRTAMNYV